MDAFIPRRPGKAESGAYAWMHFDNVLLHCLPTAIHGLVYREGQGRPRAVLMHGCISTLCSCNVYPRPSVAWFDSVLLQCLPTSTHGQGYPVVMEGDSLCFFFPGPLMGLK